MSKLQTALLNARPIVETSEWQLDIVRDILQGTTGTKAQRAAILRIIDQNKVNRSMILKLTRQLTGSSIMRTRYTPIPES